jgi:hypothetical protein
MQGEGSKPAQTANLFLLEDLEDVSRTRKLAESDLNALHTIADWIKTFVARPHKDLGRTGPVCPFVPVASERKKHLGVPSYVEDGLVLGGFYESNEASAIYNPSLRPFTSPVPFLLVRRAVISDWKFFLDNEDWLNLWARRYGGSGVQALAEELRRTNWRRLES